MLVTTYFRTFGCTSRMVVLMIALTVLTTGTHSSARAAENTICTARYPGFLDHLTRGPDGNIWSPGRGGNILYQLKSNGTITTFPVTGTTVLMGSGPDGNIWFTGYDTAVVGRMTLSGTVTIFPLPMGSSTPYQLAAGPDGNIWVTEPVGDHIDKISTEGVVLAQFTVLTTNSQPGDIVSASDGNLWFVEHNASQIGRITPDGAITEFPVPSPLLGNLINGPDGNLWFLESTSTSNFRPPDKLGRMMLDGTVTEFLTGALVSGITAGADGNIWYITYNRYCFNFGRMTTSGVVTNFLSGTCDGLTFSIADFPTSGGDGRIWFDATINGASRIGAFDPQTGYCHYFLPLVLR